MLQHVNQPTNAGEFTMSQNAAPLLCEDCAQLGIMTPVSRSHPALQEQHLKQSKKDDGAAVRRFICVDCGAVWLRKTDKWGTHGTFRLAPNTPV